MVILVLAFGISSIHASFLDDLYKEHNRFRQQNGLRPLKVDRRIENYLRRIKSLPIEIGHNHNQHKNLKRYYLNKGCYGQAENIFFGPKVTKVAMKDWKKSPGHRSNILLKDVSLSLNFTVKCSQNAKSIHNFFQARYMGCASLKGGFPLTIICYFIRGNC